MVSGKIKDASVSVAKKNITASGVSVVNETFVDDEGSIAGRIVGLLPEGVSTFDIKISVELPNENHDAEDEDDDGTYAE